MSFQTPTSIAPQLAASAVRAHEQEHVQNNEQKAAAEGMKAISTVSIHSAACPECGRIYVSGGTTTTTFSSKQQAGAAAEQEKGTLVNIKV